MDIKNKILVFTNNESKVAIVKPIREQQPKETDQHFVDSFQSAVLDGYTFIQVISDNELPTNDNQEFWFWDNLTSTIMFNDMADLVSLKVEAIDQIDITAETARLGYITAGSGQSLVYQEKIQDAKRYKQDGYPLDVSPYKWIASESATLGVSPTTLSDTIISKYDEWSSVGIQIETIRLASKNSIKNATTVDQVISIQDATVLSLEMI